MTLAEHLSTFTSDLLRSFSKKLGLRHPPTRKAELARALAETLHEYMREWLANLDDGERLLLADLAHGDEGVDPRVFIHKYCRDFPALHSGYSYSTDTSLLAAVLTRENGCYCLVEELRDGLKRSLPAPTVIPARTREDVPPVFQVPEGRYEAEKEERPVHLFNGEHSVFTELRRVLTLAQAGKLRVAPKTNRTASATVRLMSDALTVPDLALENEDAAARAQSWYESPGETRAYAWPIIVQQLGWCRATGEKLTLTKEGARILGASPEPSHLRDGLKRLLSDDSFDEFNRISGIRGQSGKGRKTMTAPSSRRWSVFDAMHDWPESGWISFEEAFRLVFAAGCTYEVTTNPWYLYVTDANYGALGYDDVGDALERQYLRVLLMETFASLGLVQIAYTYPHRLWPEMRDHWGIDEMQYLGRYDGLLWVSLTALGAWCLEMREDYTPPAPPSRKFLRAEPTLELVAPDASVVSVAERAQLVRFAESTSPSVWRLDRLRILSQLEEGGALREIRSFLDAHVEGELPQTLRTFLDDLERAAGALVQAEEALLIEARDEFTALAIANDSRASKPCRHAGGAWLAVPRRCERAFRTALRQMGHVMPVSMSGGGERPSQRSPQANSSGKEGTADLADTRD